MRFRFRNDFRRRRVKNASVICGLVPLQQLIRIVFPFQRQGRHRKGVDRHDRFSVFVPEEDGMIRQQFTLIGNGHFGAGLKNPVNRIVLPHRFDAVQRPFLGGRFHPFAGVLVSVDRRRIVFCQNHFGISLVSSRHTVGEKLLDQDRLGGFGVKPRIDLALPAARLHDSDQIVSHRIIQGKRCLRGFVFILRKAASIAAAHLILVCQTRGTIPPHHRETSLRTAGGRPVGTGLSPAKTLQSNDCGMMRYAVKRTYEYHVTL